MMNADDEHDSVPLVNVQYSGSPCWSKISHFVAAPLIMLYTIGVTSRDSVIQNLILDKVCSQHYHFNDSVCNSTTTNTYIQDELQQYAVLISMVSSLIQLLPGAVLSLFLGPRVDQYGAKKILSLPMTGSVLATITFFLLIEMWPSFPVEMILVPAVPLGLSGAKVLYTMCIFKYVSAISNKRTRSINFVVADSVMIGSVPLGSLITRIIFERSKYVGLFSFSLGMQILSLLYILIMPNDKPVALCSNVAEPLCSLKNLKISIDTVRKERPFNGTKRIVCLMGILIIFSMTFSGVDMNIQYFFMVNTYHWTFPDYMNYITWSVTVLSIGSFLEISLLSYYFKVHDDVIVLLGVLIRILTLILFGLGTALWEVYLSGTVFFFVGAAFPSIRSEISKTVGPQDVGKVFAVMTSLEAFVPVVAVPLFTLVYRSTVDIHPGLVYYIAAGIMVVCLLLNIIHINLRMSGEKMVQAQLSSNKSEDEINTSDCFQTA